MYKIEFPYFPIELYVALFGEKCEGRLVRKIQFHLIVPLTVLGLNQINNSLITINWYKDTHCF